MSHADVRELQTALHTASDIAFALEGTPSTGQLAEVSDALRRALATVRTLEAEHGGATGCREHPRGAVDPLYGDQEDPLPPTWGKCLLCNDRRRRAGTGRRTAR
ncbi:hypothetical protein [Streptomyces gobiensis]|uniref:hypothetical protein n=1 Tax=Streptomyces gobiensis TaxID=2875706 RepID=UPI001E2C0C80|nr:hypothetical protein [Streptomyces gobiensis]UGY93727.1 hypothetical protein test1122_19740 [Streptomyces gobiensis]